MSSIVKLKHQESGRYLGTTNEEFSAQGTKGVYGLSKDEVTDHNQTLWILHEDPVNAHTFKNVAYDAFLASTPDAAGEPDFNDVVASLTPPVKTIQFALDQVGGDGTGGFFLAMPGLHMVAIPNSGFRKAKFLTPGDSGAPQDCVWLIEPI